MIARIFWPPTDSKSIDKWLHMHRHPVPNKYAEIGYIVPGVAAGFLSITHTGLGVIDGLVSNPLCSSQTRHRGLDAVVQKLKTEPGINRLIAITSVEDTFRRALTHGFKPWPEHKVLIWHS